MLPLPLLRQPRPLCIILCAEYNNSHSVTQLGFHIRLKVCERACVSLREAKGYLCDT